MTTAVEILMSEHRVIELVLECLDKMAGACADGKPLDATSAREAIGFLKQFADGAHHGKEERHLFPLLEQKGIPRQGGPIGCMLEEHEAGRRHIRGMSAAIDGAARGEPKALLAFRSEAQGYVDLLRQHIRKEDEVLFQMAERVLSAADQRALLAGFDGTETDGESARDYERCLAVAAELARRFGVTDAPRTQHAAG